MNGCSETELANGIYVGRNSQKYIIVGSSIAPFRYSSATNIKLSLLSKIFLLIVCLTFDYYIKRQPRNLRRNCPRPPLRDAEV